MPTAKTRTPPKSRKLAADAATIRQALQELGIDKPWYTCRLVGNRLEFHLYGGQVRHWPADPPK